jgi:hypothetical protein
LQGEKLGRLAILFTRSTLHQNQSPVSSLSLPLEVCNSQLDAANFLRDYALIWNLRHMRIMKTQIDLG